ncbi:hypothetical protein FEK47_24440 [Escherichia sp. E3659]|uniref:hypothetical protein n=1 Tax=Escherichia sp. E3659 TaxID=2044462 RepID=UPI0010FF0518|nr:hypothetical protein [Escherichia sp. E3659]TLJ02678.1 hypothetical protein FEK47_24440 [Escherichia sp. E3659]
MQNKDATFSWDPNNQQTFRYYDETILSGSAETFNKIQGCGLDVYGIALDGTQPGPLILLPDSTKSNEINWAVPSMVAGNSRFQFWEKADFRILGNRNDITLTDASGHHGTYAITFNLIDDSRVMLENLDCVYLAMSRLETMTSPEFSGVQNSNFSIVAKYIDLFYNAMLSGDSMLDVQANVVSTSDPTGGLLLNNNSSLLLNVRLAQDIESKLELLSSFSFCDSSHGYIYATSIYNYLPDNYFGDYVAIDAFDNSTVDIHTTQFSQENGTGKIIQLSGNATVTINPLNNIIPINPVVELQKPTGKCWPGMINFKSGSKATLTLVGETLQNIFDVMALNDLKIVYVDGKPVDILNDLNISFKNGIVIKLK